MRRRAVLIGGLAACSPVRGRASSVITDAKAISGARFSAGDQEFLLADVMAPPFYTLDADTPPYFEASRRALDALLSGPLEIDDVMPATRWGVRRVSATRSGSARTLQEVLVADGAVRVAPESDDPLSDEPLSDGYKRIAGLLAIERQARAARKGLWDLPAYQLFDAGNADGAIGGYHLIEGAILRAEKHGGRFYLNFGEDFRTDFTASAATGLSRRWLKQGIDLAALRGAQVCVRGFVEQINGPAIDLKHPMQIESLA